MSKPDFEKRSLVGEVVLNIVSRLSHRQRSLICNLPIPGYPNEAISRAINDKRVEIAVKAWIISHEITPSMMRPNSFSEHIH